MFKLIIPSKFPDLKQIVEDMHKNKIQEISDDEDAHEKIENPTDE